MNKAYCGYVVYGNDHNKNKPIGIVSETHECHAPVDTVPEKFKEYLIQIEDKRFYRHLGIDLKGIVRAFIQNLKSRRIVQGGSTLTQQLARNLSNKNQKTYSRKFSEMWDAIKIESIMTKDEIIYQYFNHVYFGKNLRGIRAAGLYFFQKEVHKLNHKEFLALLTILRGPNFYILNPDKTNMRLQMINQNLLDSNLISKNRFQKNQKIRFKFQPRPLKIIKNGTIPFILSSKHNKDKIIFTTIDIKLQDFVDKFVSDSPYPVSIVAISKGNVKAFASTYGSDYPFLSKSNVGSTLKPFLYCHLHDSGISRNDVFNPHNNTLNWNVKEVIQQSRFLNLSEALFASNNNAFINACQANGIDETMLFLAKLLKKDQHELYPSSILGATKNGISLFELASCYSEFFRTDRLNQTKKDCLQILNRIARAKLGSTGEAIFLKTGTTNDNMERFAVLGNPDLTFAVLRNENPVTDSSKEGSLLSQIAKKFSSIFKSSNDYSWS